MKITGLEIRRVPPSWVWLFIHTDTGPTGLGEPYLEGHAESVIAEVARLEAHLIGQDPLRREALWAAMYRGGSGYRGGPVTMSAISGIDMALWDIAGKHFDAPVHELLGGRVIDRVPVYRAIGAEPPHTVEPGLPYRSGSKPSGEDSPLAWARAARTAADWEFRCVKLHVHLGDGPAGTRLVDGIVERFGAVRDELGADFGIAIDLHDPQHRLAIQVIRGLEPFRPLFVEEPVAQEHPALLADVAAQTSVPLAAGERWMGKWAFETALRTGALSVVQPDLAHAGGITECRKIAALAETHGAVLAPHCPLSPLAFAASVQLDASVPNFLIQEHNEVNDTRTTDGRTLIGAGYFADPFEVGEDGCVPVPRGPGWGIELDLDGLERISAHEWSATRG